MVPLKLMAFVVFLIISIGFSHPVWSNNHPADREQGKTLQQNDPKGSSPDRDHFFSPIKPNGEENFLILDSRGCPADSQRFLSPLDQHETKSQQ